MSNINQILQAELGVKGDRSKSGPPSHQHHDKVIVPISEEQVGKDLTNELQTQLGQVEKMNDDTESKH